MTSYRSPSFSAMSLEMVGGMEDGGSESSFNNTMEALVGMMEFLSTEATPMTPPPNWRTGTTLSFCAPPGGSTYGDGFRSPLIVHHVEASDDEKRPPSGTTSSSSSVENFGDNHNDGSNLEDAKQQAVGVLRGHLVRVLEDKIFDMLSKKRNNDMMVVDDGKIRKGLDRTKLRHIAKALDEELYRHSGSLEQYCDLSTLDRRIREELAMFVRKQQATMEVMKRRAPCQRRPSRHAVIKLRHLQQRQQERQQQINNSAGGITSTLSLQKRRELELRDILKSPKFELTRKLVKEINLLKLRRISSARCFMGCAMPPGGMGGGGACDVASCGVNSRTLACTNPTFQGNDPCSKNDMNDSELLEDAAGADLNKSTVGTYPSDDEESNVGARHSLPEPVAMLFFNTPLVDVFDKAPIERLRKQNWNALLAQAMKHYKAYKDYIAKNK